MAAVNSRGLATAFPLLMMITMICFADLVKGDARFCVEICSSTSYPEVCVEVLGNNVHQISTLKEIQQRFLIHGREKTEALGDEYHSIQETSSNDFGNVREHLSAYKTCEKAYKDSAQQYSAAYRSYVERKYRKVKEKLNKVVSNARKCSLRSSFEDETAHESRVATINLDLIDLNGHP